MSPIDDFLARVEKRLLVRRRPRREIIEEMRGHLETLQTERGAPFHDVDAIVAAFGEPRSLARRINVSVPWTQARLPWKLLAIGPAAMVVLCLVAIPIFATLDVWFNDRMSGAAAYCVFLAATSLIHWAGPSLAMAYAIRLGARGSHAWLGVLCPSLIFAGMILAAWLALPGASAWQSHALRAIGVLSLLAVSSLLARVASVESTPLGRVGIALLLVTLATEVVTAAVSPLPIEATTIIPRIGKLAAMALLVLALPRLARREPPGFSSPPHSPSVA